MNKSFRGAVVLAFAMMIQRLFAQFYTVTMLDRTADSSLRGYDLNSSGTVIGSARATPPQFYHAFTYSGSSKTDLGSFGSFSRGNDINDAGAGVGAVWLTPGTSHAAIFNGGSITDLGTLGGSTSTANGINNQGQVVGQSGTTPSNSSLYHAFIYENGVMKDLGSGAGASGVSSAHDINNFGQITGQSQFSPTGFYAFIYANGSFTNLGHLGDVIGGALGGSSGNSINDLGQVTGLTTTPNGFRAFLYSNGVMTNLGTLDGKGGLSLGEDINNFGHVVGHTSTVGNSTFDSFNSPNSAFLFSNGVMTDLNNQIGFGSGWILQSATGINDAGQITGYGIFKDEGTFGFLLNPTTTAPVYEQPFIFPKKTPDAGSTLVMLALGLAVQCGILRMKQGGRTRRD